MADMDDNGWRDANDDGAPRKGKGDNKLGQPPVQTFVFWLVLIAVIVMGYYWLQNQEKAVSLVQSEFERALLEKRVTEVVIKSDPGTGTRRLIGMYRTGNDTTALKPYHVDVTYSGTLDDMIRANCAHVDTQPVSNMLGQLLFSILPIIIIVVIFYFLFARQIRNAGKGALQFGKSRARLIQKLDKVTFADVAGIEEAKSEVEEIIDFLRDPEKFHRLGGRIPKGVLMVGPPGTGKTLLARAIAGEADVPFFNISGSDFVEMFVGVGASRVRDMFEQAKKNAPCIIFIDEIDAVGRSRFSGIGGGHDEREQTLNALLVEMDGFEGKAGVIVMAATNRPDVLDPALLRPGRFDRQISIDLPDLNGRFAILKVHAKKVKLGDNVDLQGVARGTPGFSGADLANLVNEAALLAARSNQDSIRMADLEEARDKVRWGKERRSRVMDEHDREVTAYHEAGHALVGLHCRHSIPLHKVTIIPRGTAFLGATMYLPEQDKYTTTRSELEDKLKMLMGGRCAEMLVFNESTSGASMDIKQASAISRTMVCQWGMSDKMGLVNYGDREEQAFPGAARSADYSEETAREIDQEVRRMVDTAEQTATRILTEHRDQLMLLGKTLLTKETMDVREIKELLGMAVPSAAEPPPPASAPPPAAPAMPSPAAPLAPGSMPAPGGMNPTPAV